MAKDRRGLAILTTRRIAFVKNGCFPRQPFAQPRGDALRLLPGFAVSLAFLAASAALNGATPDFQIHVDFLR
jgi:hypothetical protein